MKNLIIVASLFAFFSCNNTVKDFDREQIMGEFEYSDSPIKKDTTQDVLSDLYNIAFNKSIIFKEDSTVVFSSSILGNTMVYEEKWLIKGDSVHINSSDENSKYLIKMLSKDKFELLSTKDTLYLYRENDAL